jgi:hypothetical protein
VMGLPCPMNRGDRRREVRSGPRGPRAPERPINHSMKAVGCLVFLNSRECCPLKFNTPGSIAVSLCSKNRWESAGSRGSGRLAARRLDWPHAIFPGVDGQSALHLPQRMRLVRSSKG